MDCIKPEEKHKQADWNELLLGSYPLLIMKRSRIDLLIWGETNQK